MSVTAATTDIASELAAARSRFPAFNSAHEGYAVILEELDELKEQVFWGPQPRPDRNVNPDELRAMKMQLMRAEAVQVAAMAQRFIEDVCDA